MAPTAAYEARHRRAMLRAYLAESGHLHRCAVPRHFAPLAFVAPRHRHRYAACRAELAASVPPCDCGYLAICHGYGVEPKNDGR